MIDPSKNTCTSLYSHPTGGELARPIPNRTFILFCLVAQAFLSNRIYRNGLPMRYLLFDIDGTLTAGGSGGSFGPRALNIAFEELYGIPDAFSTIRMAGKTDPIITREAFDLHGLVFSPVEEHRLRERYLVHLDSLLNTPEGRMRVLDGVHDVLGELMHRPDVVRGLLTGNWIDGAQLKLANAGLDGYFSDGASTDTWNPLGAFGDDAPTRPELVPVAWRRFRERMGRDIAPDDTLIIGDTPLDIACAHANGVHAVGVATGPFSADDLADAGADTVLDDLADVSAVVRVLVG